MADNREHTEALDRLRDRLENYHSEAHLLNRERDEALAEVDRLHRQITQLADQLDGEATELTGIGHLPHSAANRRGAADGLRDAARRVRALGQPAPQPVPDNQENTV